MKISTNQSYEKCLDKRGAPQYVYVTNDWSDYVSVIRTSDNTVVDSITVGTSPHAIAAFPTSDFVYVGCFNNDTVSVIGY